MSLKTQPRYSNQRDQDEFDNAMKSHGSGWKNSVINFLESNAVLEFKKQNPKCVFFSKFYATNGRPNLSGIPEAFQHYIKNRGQREKKAAKESSASGDKKRKLSTPSVQEEADPCAPVTLPLEVLFPNTSN